MNEITYTVIYADDTTEMWSHGDLMVFGAGATVVDLIAYQVKQNRTAECDGDKCRMITDSMNTNHWVRPDKD
jgi:hypothetical protein